MKHPCSGCPAFNNALKCASVKVTDCRIQIGKLKKSKIDVSGDI